MAFREKQNKSTTETSKSPFAGLKEKFSQQESLENPTHHFDSMADIPFETEYHDDILFNPGHSTELKEILADSGETNIKDITIEPSAELNTERNKNEVYSFMNTETLSKKMRSLPYDQFKEALRVVKNELGSSLTGAQYTQEAGRTLTITPELVNSYARNIPHLLENINVQDRIAADDATIEQALEQERQKIHQQLGVTEENIDDLTRTVNLMLKGVEEKLDERRISRIAEDLETTLEQLISLEI